MARLTRKKALVLALAVAAASIASLAFAAWLSSGTGSAYAKAGSAEVLSTVDVSASTTATLYPGATGDALIKISNPNPYPVRITSVSLNGTNTDITPDAGHATCSPTGVSFSNRTGLTIDVPAKSGGVNGLVEATLTGAVSMANTSSTNCQGATFTIPVTFSGSSNAS